MRKPHNFEHDRAFISLPGQSIIPEPINQATSFESPNASTQARLSSIDHFLPSHEQRAEECIMIITILMINTNGFRPGYLFPAQSGEGW